MLELFLALMSLFIGVTVTVQSAVNGRLRGVGGNPIFASCASYLGGLALLMLVFLAAGAAGVWPFPNGATLGRTRWWMYTGGLFGTGLVLGSIIIPQKIGFGAYFSMLVAGQLVGSVLADAVGLLGAQVHLPGFGRIAGVVCLVAGALLIQKKPAHAGQGRKNT